ncbi:hypothetical protein HK100_011793 [Physocladia obscura]|uniref:Glycosyltransferase 2-like domain-containing protein n=1 Tax=Physocladia obscura TaxID=109957 RepID=A0AAD5T3L2_9FUNG|nr:hypothetical protein HK100_011793 [Physocladia obscura]
MAPVLPWIVLFCYVGTLGGLLVALTYEENKGSSYLYYCLTALNGLIALYVIVEAICALVVRAIFPPHKVSRSAKHSNKPNETLIVPFAVYSSTCIIAAYLPNEKDLIVDTVNHFLNAVDWPCAHAIVLAYNTPHDLTVENQLQQIALSSAGRFQVLRVPDSKSKAENVNHALSLLANKNSQTHIVSVFDADHRPYPDAITQVISTLHQFEVSAKKKSKHKSAVCVQGRCIIRNGGQTIITRIIEPEFDMIYNIFHVGFNALHGHGLFGGSNGHWRAPALSALLMDDTMLTEDIDLSVRALANDMHIIYDHRVRSSEEAPTTLAAYVKQRQRWAQGWFQITLHRSFWAIRSTKSIGMKFGMVMFLIFRELSFHFNTLLTIQVIIGLVRNPSINNYIWIAAGTFGFLFIVILLSVQNKLNGILFCLVYLLYSYLQIYIVLISEVKEFLAIAKWKVTKRTVPNKIQRENNESQVALVEIP